MIILTGSSPLTKQQLLILAETQSTLILNPKRINSIEELDLAEKLAENTIKQKRNMARTKQTEFLLFLSARTDIRSAIKEYTFATPKNLLLISFKTPKARLIKLFKLKETKLNLKQKATVKEIESISLSRIK